MLENFSHFSLWSTLALKLKFKVYCLGFLKHYNNILQISIPIGAVECWTFMSCLELVEALKNAKVIYEQKNNTSQCFSTISNEKLLLEYASLWNLARLKVA